MSNVVQTSSVSIFLCFYTSLNKVSGPSEDVPFFRKCYDMTNTLEIQQAAHVIGTKALNDLWQINEVSVPLFDDCHVMVGTKTVSGLVSGIMCIGNLSWWFEQSKVDDKQLTRIIIGVEEVFTSFQTNNQTDTLKPSLLKVVCDFIEKTSAFINVSKHPDFDTLHKLYPVDGYVKDFELKYWSHNKQGQTIH